MQTPILMFEAFRRTPAGGEGHGGVPANIHHV
jgi:hypothetical protein